jgi:hypothetical protein
VAVTGGVIPSLPHTRTVRLLGPSLMPSALRGEGHAGELAGDVAEDASTVNIPALDERGAFDSLALAESESEPLSEIELGPLA